MATVLSITGDFESSKDAVIAAMLFPRCEAYSVGYCHRMLWRRRLQASGPDTASALDIQAILDAPSRAELRIAAADGVKRGSVAGDLLAMLYEDWRLKKPEPSIRSALRHYRKWSLGKRYGDGTALLYSDAQLRAFFDKAKPAAHLWAAFRLLNAVTDRGKRYRTAFTRDGMPYFLGVAREMQDFATTFVPKRTKPPKPVVDADTLLQIPAHIAPIRLDLRPL